MHSHTCQSIQFTGIKYRVFSIILGGKNHTAKWIQENIIFRRFCCCFKLSKKIEKLSNEQPTDAPVALSNATTGLLPKWVSFCSTSISLHTLICTHACMHKYMLVHIHACVHTHTHTHTHTHACIKHTQTHTHTHTQSQAQTWCAYTRGGKGERQTDRDTDRDKKETDRQREFAGKFKTAWEQRPQRVACWVTAFHPPVNYTESPPPERA